MTQRRATSWTKKPSVRASTVKTEFSEFVAALETEGLRSAFNELAANFQEQLIRLGRDEAKRILTMPDRLSRQTAITQAAKPELALLDCRNLDA